MGPQPVGRIAAELPVSRPAVSQHLKILGEAGLVTMSAKGTRRYYALAPEGVLELRSWLDGLWDVALAAFAEEAHRRAAAPTQPQAEDSPFPSQDNPR